LNILTHVDFINTSAGMQSKKKGIRTKNQLKKLKLGENNCFPGFPGKKFSEAVNIKFIAIIKCVRKRIAGFDIRNRLAFLIH
jgi:hypothetical protein